MNTQNSKRTLVLTYKVQKTVEVEIADFTLTNDEIESKMNSILSKNAPDDGEILDSDYEWFGDDCEPKPKGCESIPPDNCWVEIDGRGWATNGWCLVSSDAPVIENDGLIPAWHPANAELKIAIKNLISGNKMRQRHLGYFHRRFAIIAQIPGIEVYGDKLSPGYCWVGDRLIAIVMPTKVNESGYESEYFTFNHNEA